MGLRYVKGLSAADGARIVAARNEAPFRSLEDFARRSAANEKVLRCLAESGALAALSDDRRTALWEALEIARNERASLPIAVAEASPSFAPLDPTETIAWDYRTSHHSTRGHPLGPLRSELRAQGLPDARTVAGMPDGARIRYAGIVICRQRPSTARGVVFMTLEDESGFVNLVVWESVFERFDVIAKTASFLGVTGKLQSHASVVHLVAEKLWVPTLSRKPEAPSSHDFR
jgi:error-prone DNA polymerase